MSGHFLISLVTVVTLFLLADARRSDSVGGFQRRSANQLARLLKRNPAEQFQEDEGDARLFHRVNEVNDASEQSLQDQLAQLEYLNELAALNNQAGEVGAVAASNEISPEDAEVLLAQLAELYGQADANGGTNDQMLIDLDTLVADLPSADANRVALAYLLDSFNLDMEEGQFNTLVDQVNNLEKSYAILSDTLANIQVEE
eukprot:GHVN01051140.1.p1 GENE.GHVN01051140.1~~GHVN01051140.1.p1  ORF type:complete len:201 (-),score=45.24 GHVN01051140.1:817-1419(-)